MKYWFSKCSEMAAAAMLAAIFVTFLLQIFSRYILVSPFSWTLEVCLTLWLWLIFWSSAFVLKHDEHVTFDVIYHTVRPKIRKVLALIGSLSIVVAFVISAAPTWSFIDFLQIKPSTILQIPMRNVFGVYMIFLFSTIVIYSFRIVSIIRWGLPEARHTHDVQGSTANTGYEQP